MEISKNLKDGDLIKLAKLIIAVQKAGLTLNGHGEASVNPNSGNVYIWSEDWLGCVYIRPGSGAKPRWNWSCSNCGHEVDFPTYKALEKFSERTGKRYDDECEECSSTNVNYKEGAK